MLRIAAYLILFTATITSSLTAAIVYVGKRPAVEAQLNRLAAAPWDEKTLDSAAALLTAAGYPDAIVRRSGDSLFIEAGQRARLERVRVTGDTTYEIDSDGHFTRRHLQELIDSNLQRWYDRGYYFATLQITSVQRDGPRVQLDAELNRGPIVRVADIRFTGLSRSRPYVIERLLPVGRGDTLTAELIRDTEAAADKIGFAHFRPPARVAPQPGYGSAVLELEFDEKKQFRVEGSGGYLSENSTGLVWSLQLGFTNLFGGGRQARLSSERREKGRNSLQLLYRQPLFIAGVGYFSASVATRDYRDQFYEFAVTADYETSLRAGWSAGFGVGFKTVTPADEQRSLDRYHLTLSLSHGTFRQPSNPRIGWGMNWSLTYAHRRYGSDSLSTDSTPSVFNDTRAAVLLKAARPIWRRSVLYLEGAYLGYHTGESLPPVSELYLVGGPGSLRGYRNERFAAIHVARVTVEPRLRFERAFLFAFYDGAYLNNRTGATGGSVVTDEQYRYGYGLGLAVLQPGRQLKLSLGWNPELPSDQPWLSVEFSADI